MSKRTDKEFILDMIIACDRIISYTRVMSFEDFLIVEKENWEIS